ncbi:RNA polymerase II degradation factor 1 [Exaiptasia diaphana]|uniref:Uncharacterized protein n=1 Tax=Exaiptasia diaphana TaxID=2652724 RepID=A0A913XZJ2_EXADI|nr:RNA polymerase II degradation factor 1 [Exaiptasia diaphana]KXJ23953.1 hypothetical protein AC249_AIPGENE161 [Exaiptasia diaphana]
MDFRICFALACLLGTTLSAPVAQQNTRNFIPDRYDVRGELLNDDGSFSRQDPPEEEEEPSLYDQFNNGQDSNLAYQQPQNDYQSQYAPQYGNQAYNNFQDPSSQFNTGGQDQQTAFYNSQQYPQQDQETTNDMPYTPISKGDDISKDDTEPPKNEFYDQPRQDYQNYQNQYQNYNEQPQQQGYFDQQSTQQQYNYQPQSQELGDIQGVARDQPSRDDKSGEVEKDDLSNEREDEGESSKRDEITRQNMKKYEIPHNLSQKDLNGMLGFTKQIYLRGGH